VLETVAAAPLVQKLALEIGQRQADAAPGLDRQVLEEKGLAVREVQAAKRVDGGVGWGGLADAAEIVVESHCRDPIIRW